MYLTARADTVVGEYVNEYVWFLTFDEAETQIVESKEFVDTVMNRDFFPKLAKAMREQQTDGETRHDLQAVNGNGNGNGIETGAGNED